LNIKELFEVGPMIQKTYAGLLDDCSFDSLVSLFWLQKHISSKIIPNKLLDLVSQQFSEPNQRKRCCGLTGNDYPKMQEFQKI